MVMLRSAVLGVVLASCALHPRHAANGPSAASDVTLYRDVAVVRQRIEVDVAAHAATVAIQIAAGVAPDKLVVIDRGGLTIAGVHVAATTAAIASEPTAVHVDVTGPHAGHYAIVIAYVT